MTPKERAVELLQQNEFTNTAIAKVVGVDEATIRRWRKELLLKTLDGGVEIDESSTSLQARFTSTTPITTKEEAAAKAGVDLTKWQVERIKTKAYQVTVKAKVNGRDVPVVQQMWAIAVTFAPKDGPSTIEQIEAMVDGVLQAKKHVAAPVTLPRLINTSTQQQVVIADPHLSKLCWPKSTGGDPYDLSIARKLVMGGVQWLVGREGGCQDRVLAFLGDYFHYDTLQGTTTAGTMQDRDSRLPKMFEAGTELAVQVIKYAARLGKVKVILVPGNHDAVLTVALQRVLLAEFRQSGDVEIDCGHTKRKVHTYGKNLFMYDHGDRRKKELAATLSIEHPELWGQSTYREIHTGHLHQEIDVFHGTQTHHGCLVYTHPSMSPPDQWHADEQYIGATRGMKAFTYDIGGGQIASFTATPRILLSS